MLFMFPPDKSKNSQAYLAWRGMQFLPVHTSCSGQPTEQIVRRRRETHHRPGMWGQRGELGGWGPGGEVAGYNTGRSNSSAWILLISQVWVWLQMAKIEQLVGTFVLECRSLSTGCRWDRPLSWHGEVIAHTSKLLWENSEESRAA